MQMSKQFLIEKRDDILQIARLYGAHDVRIFGSVARGDNSEASDLDIIVRFDSDRTLLDHAGLIHPEDFIPIEREFLFLVQIRGDGQFALPDRLAGHLVELQPGIRFVGVGLVLPARRVLVLAIGGQGERRVLVTRWSWTLR